MALTAKKVYAILKRQISDMEAKLNSPVRYRGTVATADLLPLNPDIGDMYNIESKSVYGEAGMNVAWNGVVWDTMGAPIDMSLYLTKEEAEAVIQRLVTEYFEKNPVKPGATIEQAQQIEQNKTDIASLKTETGSLKEDISTKITKFYASSQGETHLADSDNGKIMDMMLYGRSEQKQYSGKSLTDFVIETVTRNGITCTNNGDGTYTLNGTAEGDSFFTSSNDFVFEQNKKYKIIGCPKGGSISTYRLDGSLNVNSDVGNGVTYTGDGNSRSIRIIVFKGVTANNLLFKPMIVDAEKYPDITYDDFEPYTGGIPSPNPDYPQEIKSVVNPTVKVVGKNLAGLWKQGFLSTDDGKKIIANNYWVNTNEYVKISVNNYAFSSDSTCKAAIYEYDRDKKYIGVMQLLANAKSTIYVPSSKCAYIKFGYNYDGSKEAITPNEMGVKHWLQLELGSTPTAYEPYHEQTVTLPYTLNAIPVESGGNVTIGSQEYIADYVDVERGKLVRMVGECIVDGTEKWRSENSYMIADISNFNRVDIDNYMTYILCDKYRTSVNTTYDNVIFARKGGDGIVIKDTSHQSAVEDWKKYLNNNPCIVHHLLITPTEIDLTSEEISAFKALATYYPTTNISANSEQLDGYTVFNYPISMENGWNYVKHQIGDTRDYIYDMDARTQDTDLQAAEAYVNSEYAVALTELEV